MNRWHLCILLGILTIVLGCSEATTLGDDEPDDVTLSATPTWEDGVGRLVRLKCGVCHTVPHSDLTPNDAPNDLDLNDYASDENIRRADVLGSWLLSGILTQDVAGVRRMPLDYATPLTQTEIEALQNWATLGLPENLAALDPTLLSGDGSSTDADPSSDTGGTNTDSGTDTGSGTGSGTGTDSGTETDDATEATTRGAELFAQVSSSGLSCASCHGPNSDPTVSGFTPVLSAPDLRSSVLTGTALTFTIRRMWDSSSRAANGDGAFDALSTEDQAALEAFVLSVR